jgi:signal transduction histidine kinase
MLIVVVATAASSYIAERNAQGRYQEGLEAQFQDQMRLFTALQEERRRAILEKCGAVSHSVRLRAALEENDAEDLYRNAFTELQGIYNPQARDNGTPDRQIPGAVFFRFLDARGKVLSPGKAPAGYANLHSLGESLVPRAQAMLAKKEQAVGYMALDRASDLSALCEVVVTRIVGWNGKDLGALVLGFAVRDVVPHNGDESSAGGRGIWLGKRLYTNSKLTVGERARIGEMMAPTKLRDAAHFPIQISNAPYLLFYKALAPDTQIEPAYEVCFYPLGNSVREQRLLRWKIASFGAIVLLIGLVASLFLAKGLAKPVDQIVAGSVENLNLRRQAERDLLETNHRLEQTLCELKTTQQQVIQQERLRALGEMASGVAHDFNNTLTPILGFTDLLLEQKSMLDDKAQTTHFLKMLRTAALDAANVVRRLREFYRPLETNEELEAVDLAEIIGEVISLTEPKWRRQAQANGSTICIKKDLEALPPVAANGSSLREALTNLIFNAVDAMPNGGSISIKTSEEGGAAVLRVSDTGSGMSEEVRRRCLEPFFSTKGENGTGLGLAMVYGIIKRHRGELEIESAPGKGTSFIIKLPFTEVMEEKVVVGEPEEKTKPALNLLVVDDEMGSREVISAFLRSDGHAVTTASNGREGLAQFKAQAFDMVITDRAMPEMNGEQMAGLMKKFHPDIPVVLVTGFENPASGTNQGRSAVDAVLSKPITLKALLNTVEELYHAA